MADNNSNNNNSKKNDNGDQSKKLQLMNASDEKEIQVQPRQVQEGVSHNLSFTELCMQEVDDDDDEEEEEEENDKVNVNVNQESATASAEEQSNLFEGMRSFFSSSASSPVSSNSNQNDNLTKNDLPVAKYKDRSRDIEESKEEIQEETHNDNIISELLFMHNNVTTPPPPEGEFEKKGCASNTIENSTSISTPASESDLPISIIHVRNRKYDYYGDITTNHQQQDDIHLEEEIVFESNPKHDYCKNTDGDDKTHPPSKASKRNGLFGFICFFLIFISIGLWLLILFAPPPSSSSSSTTTEEYTDDDHQVNTPTFNDNHNNGNIDDNTDSEDGIIIITDIFDYLLQLIAPISGPGIFIDINSPQVKALDWLANEDVYVQSLLSTSISSNVLGDLDTTLLERYALVTFYFATGGIIGGSSGSISTSKKGGSSSSSNENNEIGWLDSMRFLTSSSVCEWGGTSNDKNHASSSSTTSSNNEIGCNEKGNVIKVWIESNHLAGTIPNEFSVLTNLETASLANNMLQKTIPESFQQLSRLSFFQVASNNLSGTLSNSFLRGWKQNMEIMSFYGNQFHGTIPDLGQFSNLEVVDFAHNLLTGSIPSLGSSSSTLRMIFLEENTLEGSIPDSIYDQASLEILSLNDNFLTGTINTRVGDLAVLNSLDLSSNHGISGSIPVAFSRLQSLSRLKLTDTNISDGLEQAFCEQHNILTTSIDADCSGMYPKVSCSCCTTCCTGTSTAATTSIDEGEGGGDFDAMINRSAPSSSSPNCTVRVPSICRLQAGRFESNSERNATCTCTDDGAHFSCQDSPRCLSCNLDHTMCAANKGYGYSFDIVTGETKKFQNHIRYVLGPWSDFTLTYLHDRGGRCEMFVNGGRCRSCLSINCDNGDDGIHILCDNLMGGYNFNSCEEGNVSRSITGYLEILHVMTESRLSGCPLLLE